MLPLAAVVAEAEEAQPCVERDRPSRLSRPQQQQQQQQQRRSLVAMLCLSSSTFLLALSSLRVVAAAPSLSSSARELLPNIERARLPLSSEGLLRSSSAFSTEVPSTSAAAVDHPPMFSLPHDSVVQAAFQRGFEPYANNGGTVVAVAGKDFVIVAADTRLVDGYTVLTRSISRIFSVSRGTLMAMGGCCADVQGMRQELGFLARKYEWDQSRPLGVKPLSQLLSSNLYYRRAFPYYVAAVVGGLDERGVGAVYSYDSVGSFERHCVACTGGGRAIMQSVLDGLSNMQQQQQQQQQQQLVIQQQEQQQRADKEGGDASAAAVSPTAAAVSSTALDGGEVVSCSCAEALSLVREAFVAGAERDITLGDEVDIAILTGEGVRRETLRLSKH